MKGRAVRLHLSVYCCMLGMLILVEEGLQLKKKAAHIPD